MAKLEEEGILLPVVWVDPESVDITFVNQVLVQRQGEEWILTFGQQTPPILLGSPEENLERAKEIQYIPVRVAYRLGMTTDRLREFSELIRRVLEKYDAAKE